MRSADGVPSSADLAGLWGNPGHWTIFGYRCKDDPRVMVPKRNPAMGYTMNWASPWAVPAIAAVLAIAMAPMMAVVALGMNLAISSIVTVLAAFAAVPLTIWLVLGFCRRLARVSE